jgi:hypothetical protein
MSEPRPQRCATCFRGMGSHEWIEQLRLDGESDFFCRPCWLRLVGEDPEPENLAAANLDLFTEEA